MLSSPSDEIYQTTQARVKRVLRNALDQESKAEGVTIPTARVGHGNINGDIIRPCTRR